MSYADDQLTSLGAWRCILPFSGWFDERQTEGAGRPLGQNDGQAHREFAPRASSAQQHLGVRRW